MKADTATLADVKLVLAAPLHIQTKRSRYSKAQVDFVTARKKLIQLAKGSASAVKTVVTARQVMGLRANAFLTAGIARVSFWKFIVADAGAAVLGVPLGFGLAYFFTDQIKAIVASGHRAERWLGLFVLLALAAMLVIGVW